MVMLAGAKGGGPVRDHQELLQPPLVLLCGRVRHGWWLWCSRPHWTAIVYQLSLKLVSFYAGLLNDHVCIGPQLHHNHPPITPRLW